MWAVGSGLIVHTTDGGATWQRQFSGPVQFEGVDFVDALHGWAPTDENQLFATGTGATEIVRTTDGGASWTVQYRTG